MVEDVAEVKVRPARVDDAESIARVHIASWREAYEGIVSAEHLAGLDITERAERWRRILQEAEEQDTRTWVAEDPDDQHVSGFASLGPSRDEDADRTTLEVYSVYLEPHAWGHGVARRLMRTLLEEVPEGVRVTLWVLADNARAQRFYRRHGFVPDGVERLEEFGTDRLREVRWTRG